LVAAQQLQPDRLRQVDMGKQVCVLALVLAAAGNAHAAIGASETARLAAAAQVVNDIKTDVPADIWSKARCVVVMPDV
jgi:hypothetical protein